MYECVWGEEGLSDGGGGGVEKEAGCEYKQNIIHI